MGASITDTTCEECGHYMTANPPAIWLPTNCTKCGANLEKQMRKRAESAFANPFAPEKF